MKTTQSRALPLAAKITSLAVLVGAAGLVASGTYSGEAGQSVSYVCRNGERFVVEHLADHVRLRTGAGIFALAAEGNGARYSDGHTVFHLDGAVAIVERPGLATPAGCTAAAAT